MGLGGDNFYDAVRRAVSLGGTTSLALRVALGVLAKRLTKGFTMEGGAEMRAAVKEAEQIGAQVVLGMLTSILQSTPYLGLFWPKKIIDSFCSR